MGPGLLRQDGVCLARVHDLHEHVQRSTAHAEGDCECRRLPRVALQLSLLHAAAAPSNVMHREETGRGLVDVHDAVCTDSVLVHETAQLDEEPVRVGLLQSRAVELLQALGGLLEAQAHATQKSLDPSLAGTRVESLCVPALWTRAKQKRKFGQKGRLNVRSTAQKKKRNLKLQENIPQGNFSHYIFILIRKNKSA